MASTPPFERLDALVAQLVPFSAAALHRLHAAFTVLQLPRMHVLASPHATSRAMYFVNSGLLQLYYDKDGQDITAYIFREGLFAGSFESFLKQTPGNQYLETLEPAELLVLSFEALNDLYRDLPEMHQLVRKIVEQRFLNAQRILSSYILDSPEARYRRFLAEEGDLLLRVPHHMIASFLGITPVSLSRIRKRIS